MTYAPTVIGLAIVGAILAASPAWAKSGSCLTSPKWQTGNNSDDDEQYIGKLGENGTVLLEFGGPVADEGHPAGYTTFAAPIEGLVKGARYRLYLDFQRESNGIDREVSLSAAGLQPQSRVVFRQPGRQKFQKNYVADGDRAVIMIHMKGYMKMWSFAGLPRLVGPSSREASATANGRSAREATLGRYP